MHATPRPWTVLDATEPDTSFPDRLAGIYICGPSGEGYKAYIMPQGNRVIEKEIAELIVRAINSYDAMREALEAVVRWDEASLLDVEWLIVMQQVKAALALADGQHTTK